MNDASRHLRAVDELVLSVRKNEAIYSGMCGRNTRYTCFMGLGKIFTDELHVFQMSGYHIDFLCDNDPAKWGKKIHGYPCISPEELRGYGDDVTIIVNVSAWEDICKQLRAMGLAHVHPPYEWMRDQCARFANLDWLEEARATMQATIRILADDLSRRTYLGVLKNKLSVCRADTSYVDFAIHEEEYFLDDLLPLSLDEYFVDGGAYTGDTLRRLLDRTGGRISGASLFELNPQNFMGLHTYLDTLPTPLANRILAYNVGLWSHPETIGYAGVGDGFSITDQEVESTAKGEVDALDRLMEEARVTFIKLDIEGAEIPALRGARRIIETQRPKLAVCPYHRLEDMLSIPWLIKGMCPDHKVFLRHHGHARYGTICYAAP